MSEAPVRCGWCTDDPLYQRYHDEEWGIPCYDERRLFEFLLLEGAQAGLSWLTVLKKRENYRTAYADFDPEVIARFDEPTVERLLTDPGIIRNRRKVESAVRNARAWLALREQTDPVTFLWDFVGGAPIQNHWRSLSEVPTTTAESDAMSRALKKRGFNFVGSTICYAYMQSMGMVNDHTSDCFRYNKP